MENNALVWEGICISSDCCRVQLNTRAGSVAVLVPMIVQERDAGKPPWFRGDMCGASPCFVGLSRISARMRLSANRPTCEIEEHKLTTVAIGV